MKTIGVSTAVFAAIWARREPGEETEDAILRRILAVDPVSEPARFGAQGFVDERNGVEFPEGFQIFRTYKGKEYRAEATRGRWFLHNNHAAYSSLHKLSSAVVSGNENSWQNWKYLTHDGTEAFIDRLRPVGKGDQS